MVTEFTPFASLAGGALIGLGAVALMALNGRIFGATGILAGFMSPDSSSDFTWRLAVLLGMISGPAAYWLIFGAPANIEMVSTPALTVLGGLIVGVGVTFSSGCTSGHGVCGMARFSRRSIAATLAFMASTAATVFIVRHVLGA